jgi:acetoin utilization deacetylase AcuC-like enzyme
MKWFCTQQHQLHDPAVEVWAGTPGPATEVPARVEMIAAALDGDAAFTAGEVREHGRDPIEQVHEPALIRWLESAWAECRPHSAYPEIFPDTVRHAGMMEGLADQAEPTSSPLARLGYWCFDTMTPLVEGTYQAARGAVDVALSATDAVLSGDRAAYALCRPPGHHAARSVIGGFCFFNNAAIAASVMLEASGGPVAILDLDYHHGNGTQQIFYDRAEVLYVSLHGDPDRAFPYYTGRTTETGTGQGAGATRNFPLAARCPDQEYLAVLETALDVIAASGAAGLVVSLGLDTYELDAICDLGLTREGFWRIGRQVERLGLPTVIVQEGGYHLAHLGINARSWLHGFMGAEPGSAGSQRPEHRGESLPPRHLLPRHLVARTSAARPRELTDNQ